METIRTRYEVVFDDITQLMVIWRIHSTSADVQRLHITVWTHHLVDEQSVQFLKGESTSFGVMENLACKAHQNLPPRQYVNTTSTAQSTFISVSNVKHDASFKRMTVSHFGHSDNQQYLRVKQLLEVLCAATLPVPQRVIESIFDETDLNPLLHSISEFIQIDAETNCVVQRIFGWFEWLSDIQRAGEEFWVDVKAGHNRLSALFLKFCANKSISIEHDEQDYLVCK